MNRFLKDCYKGKTVLVTGHTGFKGSWLAVWLNALGANVVGYGLDPYTEKDNFNLTEIKNEIADIRGDIRNAELIGKIFEIYNPEIIFHMAAQPIVRYSYEHAKETFDVNIMGTVNVLEAIRRTDSVRAGVIITSDKCYQNNEWIWGYRENDPLGGRDPYSCSKACAEMVVSAYRDSFFNTENYGYHGKALATVRAGNVIGGGDWSRDRLIPDCIRALEKEEDIIIRNPDAKRPWQHVAEPLSYAGGTFDGGWRKVFGSMEFRPRS